MNYEMLTAIVAELSRTMTGGRVERVLDGEGQSLYLQFRNAGETRTLLLSPQRSRPRLHLLSSKPRAGDETTPFVLYLRSRLKGARIGAVSIRNNDRIVQMDLAQPRASYHLFFELTGSRANLIFTDQADGILSLYHPVPLTEGQQRLLVPGSHYVLPPARPQQNAVPAVAERAGPLDANRRAEEHFDRIEQEQQTVRLRTEGKGRLKKARDRTSRRLSALSVDLAKTEEADRFRRSGELIQANLKHLSTGMECAELTGYDGTIEQVQLDPRRSPSANAQDYFKRYKKAKAGRPIIIDRMNSAEAELQELDALNRELDLTTDAGALASVVARIPKVIAKQHRRETLTPDSSMQSGIRTCLVKGWTIHVGKSASGNDLLSTRLARPDDLWLHAEGLPGSHVLIRNPGRGAIPQDILVAAASLAAFYSRGKNADKVSVTYTPARFVHKPKGAKPGLVALSQRQSIMVRPEGIASAVAS